MALAFTLPIGVLTFAYGFVSAYMLNDQIGSVEHLRFLTPVAAGALLSTFFPIFPDVGASFILLAFVVVNLGGFGSITGAFWAGILVGLIEVMGGLLLGPQYKTAVVLVIFLGVLMFRPQGLMGKA